MAVSWLIDGAFVQIVRRMAVFCREFVHAAENIGGFTAASWSLDGTFIQTVRFTAVF
jgi:hypothetical protein